MSKKNRIGIGVCSECGQSTAFRLEDCGIGAYEYWGARGVHHDWQWLSECCEASPSGEVDIPEPDYPDQWERDFDKREREG